MANPTTNYGFVLPTSTDLVTDLPADFDVALQGVDTRLKALQPGTTLGDIVYSSATANTNTRLGIGSTGNVLTVAGGVPSWAAPSAGKLIQVVFASYATEVGSSSSTYADTGLTASITPTSATSKVLVFVTQQGVSKSAASSATGVKIQLLRGSTSILKMGDANANTNSLLLANIGSVSGSYLDSPATTSSTTYKTQFASTNATSQARVQNFDADSAAAVSTITLMEIGA
jgi:hypothetical protein